MAGKKRVEFLEHIRSLGQTQLREKIKNSQFKLNKLSCEHAVSPLNSPTIIRDTKRDIARMQTVLRSKTV